MDKKRNDSIELLRCILMLGICILHSCSLGGYTNGKFSRMLMPCVPCFVFISGYYGIKSTLSRIVRLIIIAFASVPIVGIVSWIVGYNGLSGWKIAAAGVVDNWFVWAYVALMCFAPMMNIAIEHPQHKTLVLPIIVLCLGWGYLKGLPYFRLFMPTTEGLGSFTFTMMIGVYLVAKLWRKYDFLINIKTLYLFLGLVVLTALCIIGFSAYCSPVSVLWAGVLFTLFSRIGIPVVIGKVICFIAKSTFPIFILHANVVGFGLIRKFAQYLCDGHGLNPYIMYVIVGFSVFFAGLLLDIPRRVIIFAINSAYGPNMKK